MWKLIGVCVYLVYLVVRTEGITYLKGVSTPKWTTRMIPLSKWLENNNWRLAPYGNKEFTKIFRQYRPVILNKYYEEAPANWTDTSLGKYVQSLFFTSTPGPTRKLLKKDKIKLGKLKLIKENMLKLEEKLGITTVPPSTTTETTTAQYTGPSTRITLTSFFDPDYIFDPNQIIRHIKRLKRDVSDRNRNHIEDKVSSSGAQSRKIQMHNVNAKANALNIFPAGELARTHTISKDVKLWIKFKREQYGLSAMRMEYYNMKETKQKRLKRGIDYENFRKIRFSKRRHYSSENHVLVKRDLGKIVRRSTKRPFLSRKFKSQSLKRWSEDVRMAEMLTQLQANITIMPEFLHMSRVLADMAMNNLSTLFYVYNNVAYFGSVPPHILTTKPTVLSTKAKSVTYELGATQVLKANIFNDEKKGYNKVSPGDVDIPVIDIEQQTQSPEPKSESVKDVTETTANKITKLKRTRKKKNVDATEISSNALKKTRAKRKSTKAMNTEHSLVNSQQNTSSSKAKGRRRVVRSLDLNSEDAESIVQLLPTFLFLFHTDVHLRRKRNANNEEETKKIEMEEKNKLGRLGKLKESLRQSKNKISAFVREKKESLFDMPRRARYIAKEMYLDGKFFFGELKEVPARMKKDYNEKKDMMKLLWDMVKIFMPVTEKGEKGGTTPEPKIVKDPKQYVKNPDDYITPDLSDLNGPHTTSLKCKLYEETELKTTKTKFTEVTSTETVPSQKEKKTVSEKHERQYDVTTITKIPTSVSTKPTKPSSNFVLVTDEPSKRRTYNTRIVGPDYIPTNTRHDDMYESTTTRTKTNRFDKLFERVQDDRTFDRLSETMKNKKFMDDMMKNIDTKRIKDTMGDMRPQDVLSKLDDRTVRKMGKLMSELDPDTIKQMQKLAMKAADITGNKIDKTR